MTVTFKEMPLISNYPPVGAGVLFVHGAARSSCCVCAGKRVTGAQVTEGYPKRDKLSFDNLMLDLSRQSN